MRVTSPSELKLPLPASKGRRERLLTAPALEAVSITALSVIAALALWQIASTQWVRSILFPPPFQTLQAAVAMLQEGVLQFHARVSLARIAVGFAIGCGVGVPLGLAMGLFQPVRVFFEPYIQFLRFVPAIAWLIPAIMWFGIGETSKISLIFYMTVFLVLLNTMAGVVSVGRNQIRAGQCFGVNRWQLFAWIIFPATMSYILTGMRIAMGNSFAAVVGAELIAADSGLGYLITDSRIWMATDRMFVGMVTLGVLGVLADRVFHVVATLFGRRYLTSS